MANSDEQAAFNHTALHKWATDMFVARGLPATDAEIVSHGVLDGDMRGVPTHGAAQLPAYFSLLDKGITNPRPDIQMTGKGCLVRVDADRALGQVATIRAIETLKVSAQQQGIAAATIANTGHLGGLGYYARVAAEAGLVSIVLQNGPPLMGLPGSTARAIGNNPLAFGAPVPNRPPLVFDIATSEAAYGKIIKARAEGASEIPARWALDSNGVPTIDPIAALEGIMLPMGGAKGIGLAMMVEVLAGSLSGTTPVAGENIFGGFVMLIDPLAVQTKAEFESHMAGWIATYQQSGTGARYPGERAAANCNAQLKSGVVLSKTLGNALAALGTEAGISMPVAL